MEDPVDHASLGEPAHAHPNDLFGVDAGGLHALDVVEREALEAFHDEDAAGDERRVRAGHHVATLVERREDRRDVDHVLGLEPEIELLADGLGEQLDERRRIGEGGDRDATHEQRRDRGHDLQVTMDLAADGRALHLHDDGGAVVQRGAVDLGDRCRGDRCAVEGGEDRLDAGAELGLDDLAHRLERFCRHLVAALLHLVDELGGEDALAGAHDLAELDVRGAEALGGLAEAARHPGAGGGPATAPVSGRPDADGTAEPPADDDQSPEGREPARPGQFRDLPAGGEPEHPDAAHPRQLVPVDVPRAVLGERPPGEVEWRGFDVSHGPGQSWDQSAASSAAAAISGRQMSRSGR